MTTSRGSLFILAMLWSWTVASSGFAQPASGIDLTPDSRSYLISKDVGDERWAITFNLEDRTVTGNVFRTDGGPPSFLWCEITDEIPASNPVQTDYTLDCFSTNGCEQSPCTADRWEPVASGIQIRGDFFLPEGSRSTLRGRVVPIMENRCATTEACHRGGTRRAG